MHEELKFILRNVDKEDQQTIEHTIPEIKKILKPEELDFFINEKSKFEEEFSTVKGREYLIFEKLDKVFLGEIKSKVDFVVSFFKNKPEKYLRAMMGLMLKSDDYISIFKENIEGLEKSIEYIRKRSYSVRKYDPKLESNHDWDKLIRCAEKICNTKSSEVDKEKCVKFSYIKGIFNKEVGIIKNKARVHGRGIRNVGELCSIVDLLEIKKERRSLEENWDQHISSRLGVERTSDFKKAVEDEISYKLHGMKNVFQVKQCYDELNQMLVEKNVVIQDFINESIESKTDDPCQELKATFDGLNILVGEPLMVVLEKKRIEELSINLQESINYLRKFSCDSTFNKEIFSSLNNRNHSTYKNNYNCLEKLNKQSKLVEKLKGFSSDISNVAPSFADDLLSRKIDQKIFDLVDMQNSWKASYLDNELTERNSVDPMEIQDSLVDMKNKLKSLDSVLIQNLSMQNQLSRITSEQRQALRGFVLAQNKITKSGKGVRDLTLRRGAKNQMKKCKGAVPVWIMPLSKVMDNFVIGEDAFDVLIIDEASQADITYLPIFSLAKKVVVVGDDKQVSPRAAGIKLDGIDELINEFLDGIPNKEVYDYRTSLYDIASSSFGETIRLVEHFRCTPEIIQFCNDLQYQGEIKVLRDSNSNPTPPSLVPFYTEGRMDSSKKNHEEAVKIASLIVAMTESEKYKNATIGVISLFGYEQHQYIDSLLHSALSIAAYEKHKITCGKAAQFQGDERNIIFLSMVESPTTEGPLRKKSETDILRKEYNVAVSRARDQLWIMHSMELEHLQSDDIRLRLLKHAKDPRDLLDKYIEIINLAESPFEKSVHKDLLRKDYRFQPQFEVGAYRIDIVLFRDDGSKVALECDGSKYHSTEEQVRNDLERQSVLERLGYTFIRIRGSDYYRRREKTVEDLYKRLDELKVSKGNSDTSKKYNNKDIDSSLLLEAEKIRLKIEAKLKQDGRKEAYPRPFKGRWNRSKRTVVSHTSSDRATINYPNQD